VHLIQITLISVRAGRAEKDLLGTVLRVVTR
jgi:hypothetical protein